MIRVEDVPAAQHSVLARHDLVGGNARVSLTAAIELSTAGSRLQSIARRGWACSTSGASSAADGRRARIAHADAPGDVFFQDQPAFNPSETEPARNGAAPHDLPSVRRRIGPAAGASRPAPDRRIPAGTGQSELGVTLAGPASSVEPSRGRIPGPFRAARISSRVIEAASAFDP